MQLKDRPFTPHKINPYHSRTHEDYAVAPDSELVTQHGFKGSFNVSRIGLTEQFTFTEAEVGYKRRDAYGMIHAERYDRTRNLWTMQAQALGSGTGATHFFRESMYPVPEGSWARFDCVDFGQGGQKVRVKAFAQGAAGGATVKFQLGSPDASGQVLSSVVVPSTTDGARFLSKGPEQAWTSGWTLLNGTPGTVAAPPGVSTVFMVFDAAPPAPPAPPPDKNPHRYWRIMAEPGDFNNSFYNANWDLCELELRTSAHGPNLATDPSRAIQSSGDGAKAFDGIVNCTQWDGCMGCKSDMWSPHPPEHSGQWVGYDFGVASPQNIAVGVPSNDHSMTLPFSPRTAHV